MAAFMVSMLLCALYIYAWAGRDGNVRRRQRADPHMYSCVGVPTALPTASERFAAGRRRQLFVCYVIVDHNTDIWVSSMPRLGGGARAHLALRTARGASTPAKLKISTQRNTGMAT